MTKPTYTALDRFSNMPKLVCKDYGYDCTFEIEGESEEVAEKFGKHTEEEHGIEYSKETLTKFMLDNNY